MHRYGLVVIAIFVLVHRPSGDQAISYDGQDQATVSKLVSDMGFPFDLISKSSYDAFIAANQPAQLTPAQYLTQAKAQASSLAITGPDADSELQRAVLLTILDQLNTIRAALPTPLSPITPNQAKTAVQNKLNSGAAD